MELPFQRITYLVAFDCLNTSDKIVYSYLITFSQFKFLRPNVLGSVSIEPASLHCEITSHINITEVLNLSLPYYNENQETEIHS